MCRAVVDRQSLSEVSKMIILLMRYLLPVNSLLAVGNWIVVVVLVQHSKGPGFLISTGVESRWRRPRLSVTVNDSLSRRWRIHAIGVVLSIECWGDYRHLWCESRRSRVWIDITPNNVESVVLQSSGRLWVELLVHLVLLWLVRRTIHVINIFIRWFSLFNWSYRQQILLLNCIMAANLIWINSIYFRWLK